MVEWIISTVMSGWGTTVLLAVISAFAGKGFLKYKKLTKEILDIGVKYKAITHEKSPGGKGWTDSEKDAFIKEVVEALQALAVVIPWGKRI